MNVKKNLINYPGCMGSGFVLHSVFFSNNLLFWINLDVIDDLLVDHRILLVHLDHHLVHIRIRIHHMIDEKGIIQDLGPDHDQNLDMELKNVIDDKDLDPDQSHLMIVDIIIIIIIIIVTIHQHPGIDHQDDKSLDEKFSLIYFFCE